GGGFQSAADNFNSDGINRHKYLGILTTKGTKFTYIKFQNRICSRKELSAAERQPNGKEFSPRSES
ncbi:MAG: hypothetical protein ACXW6R_26100, partial [Candidatus Binatia bacterium]